MIASIYIWVIMAIALSIVEMLSPGLFFFLAFSLGALITGLFSLMDLSLSSMLNIFFASSFLAFIVLVKWVNRKQRLFHPATETNIDALKGKQGYISSISAQTRVGILKIDGDVWTARTIDNTVLSEGALVEIIATRGCHVIVQQVVTK